jgi:hypothetical protein
MYPEKCPGESNSEFKRSNVPSRIKVFARRYTCPSLYCKIGSWDHPYVVAIPTTYHHIPDEIKEYLDQHSTEGDPFFVFESSTEFLGIGDTYSSSWSGSESWAQCYLEYRLEGGLIFKRTVGGT